MVLSTGWRCIRTLTIRRSPLVPRQLPTNPTTPSSHFHTAGAALSKSAKSDGKSASQKTPGGPQRTSGIKVGGKPEPPKSAFKSGERKEIRNTIVLSNSNAPSLALPEMTIEVSTHEPGVGSVFAFLDQDIKKLKILEAFRHGQDWKFFHKPSTVMRKESLILGELMARIEGMGVGAETGLKSMQSTERLVVCGPKGSGKSIYLLQAITWALQREWIVINIPNAQDLVIGHTEYDFDTATSLWSQRQYTAALLSRVLQANRLTLTPLTLSRPYTLGRKEFTPTMSLATLLEAGSSDTTISHEVLFTLLAELELPGRPPVLFTLDGLDRISLPSKYRDQDFNIIHAHDLAIPNAFLSYLNGKRSFARGLVIGATSASGSPHNEALKRVLHRRPLPSLSKLDTKIAPSIEGAQIMHLGAMQREEARGLLEYCRQSGLLKAQRELNEEEVTQRIVLSSGLAKEIVAGCVRVRE